MDNSWNFTFCNCQRRKSIRTQLSNDHFKTIISKIIEAFEDQNVINNDIIYQALVCQELSPNRIFKGKAEEYKIRRILGVLELKGFTKWKGLLRSIEYTLDKLISDLIKWSQEIVHKK